MDTATHIKIRRKYAALSTHLDERGRRLWAAAEARELGHGGIALVADATGITPGVIGRGIKELAEGSTTGGRVRRRGAGRKRLTDHDPGLLAALKALVEPMAYGEPESPLWWVSKSSRKLAHALRKQGHTISATTIRRMLKSMGFCLRRTRKTLRGRNHPDRDAQFHYINECVLTHQAADQPVISLDMRKKEGVGHVSGADSGGTAVPDDADLVTQDKGWVSVGISKDTAAFTTSAMLAWWRNMGVHAYPKATRLLITTDYVGSKGSRGRVWRRELQMLANELGLAISVCHVPPGTRKWNRIEHRMWTNFVKNWRGRPPVSVAVLIELIGSSKRSTELTVRAEHDESIYDDTVSDEELARVHLERHEFHGEWNYTVTPELRRYDTP